MRTTAYVTLLGSLLLTATSNLLGVEPALAKPLASLSVTIMDDTGSLLHNAHIYIFSRDKKEFYGTREAYGTTVFDLPPGDYRIYAGMTQKSKDTVDHYASPEASMRLSAEEPTSVILALQKAPDGNDMVLSDNARQKLEIDPELAKYLN